MFREYLQRLHQALIRGRRKARCPKTVPTTRRPVAHLRVEDLEARELLTAYPLAFNVNQATSLLAVSGYVSGAFAQDFHEQVATGSGSLRTLYAGTLNALYNPSAKTFQFVAAGSSLTAVNGGNWHPLPGGYPGQAPANYGIDVLLSDIIHNQIGFIAFRGLSGNLAHPNPVSVAGGILPSNDNIHLAGNIDSQFAGTHYNDGGITSVSTTLTNNALLPGQFQDLGSGSFHISVPIDVSFSELLGSNLIAHIRLAGTLRADASYCTAKVASGVLTATNMGPAAPLTLAHAGLTTTICGASFADNSYSSVVINTGNDGDTVNIENTLAGKPVNVNEGGGYVTVNISHSAQNLNNIQGGVTLIGGGGTNTLNVYDQANASAQTFTRGAFSVTRGGAAIIHFYDGMKYVTLSAGNGANTFDVVGTEPDTTTILNTGNGHDTVKVDGTGAGGTFTVNEGTGGVDVTLGATTHNLDSLHGTVNVNGNPSGVDNLTVDDQANGSAQTFTVDSSSITRTGVGTIHYHLLDHLTVSSGTGATTVNVLATAVPTAIIGHANGIVNVGNAGKTQGINHDLTISNPPNNTFATVNVDDSADGSFETPTLDTVTVGAFSYGRIRGLAQGDILYRYVDTNSVSVQTGAAGASVAVKSTSKPVNLVGNPGGAVSLFASDGDNTWAITGQNAGTLTSSLIAGPVTFSGVQNLTGGAGSDTFVFADGAGVDGAIDGGGGTNSLDYSAYSSSVIVDLQTGSAAGVGSGIVNNSIQNVTGGSGGGAGIYNILVGNGGNVLTGGDGRRNLLISGATASTLYGGNDDDILIAGTTAYDAEVGLISLQAIMDYWSNTADDYATRVANLLSGNGVPLLDASMVTGNGPGNTLLGNHGGAGELNLFFGSDPASQTTDYNAAIGEQWIYC